MKLKKSIVFYKIEEGGYWGEHLSLGFIMGHKSVSNSTCFSGRDWELLENITHAQSEAFYAHGENIDSLLIGDLKRRVNMNIENCIKYTSYTLLTLICLLLLPMLVIGSINTLFEGYILIKHNIFTYISFYIILLITCVRVNFNFN